MGTATRKLVLAPLLLGANRVIYDRLPEAAADEVDQYILDGLCRLAMANMGAGFEAIQAALKLKALRDMPYEAMRAAAKTAPDCPVVTVS